MGVKVYEARLPHCCQGIYDDDRRIICLDQRMSQRQTLCTLQHELIHARYRDVGCAGRNGVRNELRAQRETALALIDPMGYRTAEQMYEGDKWLMSVELGVTLQVLSDYQTLLREWCCQGHSLQQRYADASVNA